MKTTFLIVFLVIILLFIADTTIQFNPFKISFQKLSLAIGTAFIFVGLAFMLSQTYRDGFKDGTKLAIEVIRESAEEAKLKNNDAATPLN